MLNSRRQPRSGNPYFYEEFPLRGASEHTFRNTTERKAPLGEQTHSLSLVLAWATKRGLLTSIPER